MRQWLWLCLAFAAAAPAYAQFDLLVVENGQEHAVPSVYNLGSFYANETATAHFRLRNISASPATLSVLTVAGIGFVLSSTSLPVGVAPQGSIDLSVAFRAGDTGTYSASLNANGISILLTTLILPRLTYRVDPSLGPSQPGTFPGPLDFGSAARGESVQLRIRFQNESSQALTVPAIGVAGDDFGLTSPTPSGQSVQPGQGGEFTLAFIPRNSGVRQGALVLGDRTYVLTGVGVDLTPPNPVISINLPQAASAQQGILTVRFDAPTRMAGTGTAAISPTATLDSAIGFATGGRQVTYDFAPGDRQVALAFQTGTTAGPLTFTVEIQGGGKDQQTIQIGAAAPAVTGMQAVRSSGTLELRLTGFDNTRSIGALAFTFYDAMGNIIAPGVIRVDAAVEFSRYFAASDLGGAFLLNLAFPVSGDAAGIAACEAALTNSAGSSKTVRMAF